MSQSADPNPFLWRAGTIPPLFQHVTRTEGAIQLEGSNASAEEFDEGTESNSVSGIDLVIDNRLTETGKLSES